MKKTIIHFMFSLARGGAETMVLRVIKELPEYKHIVVTLYSENHFGDELQCDKYICLNLGSLFKLPLAIRSFNKIVKHEKADIVHTHLFWPTFIARLSVPKKIPLVTTIHQFISSSVEYRNWYIRFLDRISYKYRKSTIIVVAKGAKEEYFDFLRVKPHKAYVLYTFVDVNRFKKGSVNVQKTENDSFNLIAVGALREQKNFSFLISAMAMLKSQNITLDIYGTGNLHDSLQKMIDDTGAKVTLKGMANNIHEIIPAYDLFVLPSTYEGFSLGVLEAMAMGMPLLLSDNPSFKEQAKDIAWFFSLKKIEDLIDKISMLSKTGTEILTNRGEMGRLEAVKNFTLDTHVNELRNIYNNEFE